MRELNATDFSNSSGLEHYDFDLGGLVNEVRLVIHTDKPSRLYAVGPEIIIPISDGLCHSLRGLYRGISSFRLVPSDKDAVVAYSLFSAALKDSQRLDTRRITVPLGSIAQGETMSAAIRAVVRQQLLAAGINLDGDLEDFGDGDLGFDDDADDFGGSSFYDDDPELPFDPERAPVPAPPPPPKQEAPRDVESESNQGDQP